MHTDVCYLCCCVPGYRWCHIRVSPQLGPQWTHSWGDLWLIGFPAIIMKSFIMWSIDRCISVLLLNVDIRSISRNTWWQSFILCIYTCNFVLQLLRWDAWNFLAGSDQKNNEIQFIGQRFYSTPGRFATHAFWNSFLPCCKNCSVLQIAVLNILQAFKVKKCFLHRRSSNKSLNPLHKWCTMKKIFELKHRMVVRSYYKTQHMEDSGKYLLYFNLTFTLTTPFHCVAWGASQVMKY